MLPPTYFASALVQLRCQITVADRSPAKKHSDAGLPQACRYDEDAALTFGRAISGMLAQSRGRSLGIFQTKDQVPAAAPPMAVLLSPAALCSSAADDSSYCGLSVP